MVKEKKYVEASNFQREIEAIKFRVEGLDRFKEKADKFSFDSWSLPQLEALNYLLKRNLKSKDNKHGSELNWSEAWFERGRQSVSSKEVSFNPISLFDWVIEFKPDNGPTTTEFLEANVTHKIIGKPCEMTGPCSRKTRFGQPGADATQDLIARLPHGLVAFFEFCDFRITHDRGITSVY